MAKKETDASFKTLKPILQPLIERYWAERYKELKLRLKKLFFKRVPDLWKEGIDSIPNIEQVTVESWPKEKIVGTNAKFCKIAAEDLRLDFYSVAKDIEALCERVEGKKIDFMKLPEDEQYALVKAYRKSLDIYSWQIKNNDRDDLEFSKFFEGVNTQRKPILERAQQAFIATSKKILSGIITSGSIKNIEPGVFESTIQNAEALAAAAISSESIFLKTADPHLTEQQKHYIYFAMIAEYTLILSNFSAFAFRERFRADDMDGAVACMRVCVEECRGDSTANARYPSFLRHCTENFTSDEKMQALSLALKWGFPFKVVSQLAVEFGVDLQQYSTYAKQMSDRYSQKMRELFLKSGGKLTGPDKIAYEQNFIALSRLLGLHGVSEQRQNVG